MAILNSYLNNRDASHRSSQKWAKDKSSILGDSFWRSSNFSAYNKYKQCFEEWLSEMKENHISFEPFRLDKSSVDALDNNVQRHEVQSFVGAVAGTPSKKGVFITTSDYSKGAMEYVESLNGSPTIILINGQQLTEYIYDYGLGLQTEKVLKVMKMDMDYWDAMDNA